jgi:hypothetical protein
MTALPALAALLSLTLAHSLACTSLRRHRASPAPRPAPIVPLAVAPLPIRMSR